MYDIHNGWGEDGGSRFYCAQITVYPKSSDVEKILMQNAIEDVIIKLEESSPNLMVSTGGLLLESNYTTCSSTEEFCLSNDDCCNENERCTAGNQRISTEQKCTPQEF